MKKVPVEPGNGWRNISIALKTLAAGILSQMAC
jgi:hypothetical protein